MEHMLKWKRAIYFVQYLRNKHTEIIWFLFLSDNHDGKLIAKLQTFRDINVIVPFDFQPIWANRG